MELAGTHLQHATAVIKMHAKQPVGSTRPIFLWHLQWLHSSSAVSQVKLSGVLHSSVAAAVGQTTDSWK